MKCPFRKLTSTARTDRLDVVEELFDNCYRKDCMAYVPEIDNSSRHYKDITAARCLRMDWRVILSEII